MQQNDSLVRGYLRVHRVQVLLELGGPGAVARCDLDMDGEPVALGGGGDGERVPPGIKHVLSVHVPVDVCGTCG